MTLTASKWAILWKYWHMDMLHDMGRGRNTDTT